MTNAPVVEVLHHEGCPLFDAAWEVVQACVAALQADVVVTARVERCASPTVLVSGRDVMGVGGDEPGVSACRLDVPTHARVFDALRSAIASSVGPA